MLNILHRKETDEEFVERIRRQAPACRRAAAILSAIYVILLLALLYFVPRYVYVFRDMAPDASGYDRGFALGLFLGAATAGAIVFLIWQLIQSLNTAFGPESFRIHQLLVKYHDLAAARRTKAGLNDAS